MVDEAVGVGHDELGTDLELEAPLRGRVHKALVRLGAPLLLVRAQLEHTPPLPQLVELSVQAQLLGQRVQDCLLAMLQIVGANRTVAARADRPYWLE